MKNKSFCRAAFVVLAFVFSLMRGGTQTREAEAQSDSQFEKMVEMLLRQQRNALITLKNPRGKVEVSEDGGRTFFNALENSTLSPVSVVKTSFGSGVTIVISKSSVIILEPVTSLSVDSFVKLEDGSEVIQVRLLGGRAGISVDNRENKVFFTAMNPAATINVRGTKFFLDTYGVSVADGLVAFRGRDGRELLVSKGQRAEVSAGGNTTYIVSEWNSRPAPPFPPPVNARPFNPLASPMNPPPAGNFADFPINWPPSAQQKMPGAKDAAR